MKVLLIYAHPNPESFTYAVVERLQAGLACAKHEVHCIDLYQEEFDPVLVVSSSRHRRDLIHDPYTERYRALIAAADQLISLDAPGLVAWLDPGWLSMKYSILWYSDFGKLSVSICPA